MRLFKRKNKEQTHDQIMECLRKTSKILLIVGTSITIFNIVWHTLTCSYWWYLTDIVCALANSYSFLCYTRSKYRSFVSQFVLEDWYTKSDEFNFLPESLKELLGQRGWGNGYVIIPAGHPFWKQDIWEGFPVNVHGGLTYSGMVDYLRPEWHKFKPQDRFSYVIGFDTAHAYDSLGKWPKSRVMMEAYNLEAQVIALDQQTHWQREMKFHSDITSIQIERASTFENLTKFAVPLLLMAAGLCITILILLL